MAAASATVSRWPHAAAPSSSALEALIREEKLSPNWWSNGPGDRYAAHAHGYHKILYCVRGSIRFTIAGGESIDLAPGDRLDIPPGSAHAAEVGPQGVSCVEAARRG